MPIQILNRPIVAVHQKVCGVRLIKFIEFLTDVPFAFRSTGQFSHSNLNTPEDVPCLFNLNDEIKYACKSGYTKASGSEKLSCIRNNGKAEWSGKPLNCKSKHF